MAIQKRISSVDDLFISIRVLLSVFDPCIHLRHQTIVFSLSQIYEGNKKGGRMTKSLLLIFSATIVDINFRIFIFLYTAMGMLNFHSFWMLYFLSHFLTPIFKQLIRNVIYPGDILIV